MSGSRIMIYGLPRLSGPIVFIQARYEIVCLQSHLVYGTQDGALDRVQDQQWAHLARVERHI